MGICLGCGKSYPISPGSHGVVCSLKCWAAIKSKVTKGSPHPRGRGGKRDDLGGLYVRSSWEANWARYLNWLQQRGEIVRWEYEPEAFEFHKVRKGTRFYTPDFKVWNKDGSIEYHEVKGWLDAKGRTKLERMKKYYPTIKIVLIGLKDYRSVSKTMRLLIPEWEHSSKRGF